MTPAPTLAYAYSRALPDGRLLTVELLPRDCVAVCIGTPELVDELELKSAPQQRCLSRPCAPACRRAARPRQRAGRHASARGAAGPAAGDAGAGGAA